MYQEHQLLTEPLSLSYSTLSLVPWPDPSISQSSPLTYHLTCAIRYSEVSYLAFMVFFINDSHVSLFCNYKMICLYSKIPKDFTRVVLNDCLWLMLIPCRFNMDSIRSTNFPPQISQWIRLLSQSCFLLYSFWASLGHSHTVWLIVSSALLHIQYFFCSCDFWIFPIIKLVRMASQVFCFTLYGPFSQLLPPILISHLVCCTNWPCNIVSSPEIFRSFFCLLASIVASGIASTKLVFTDLAAVS